MWPKTDPRLRSCVSAGMSQPTDIAALIGSRICHDLVNPIGAIGNGVELLGMIGVEGEELALIRESVAQAQTRLLLMRLAFGTASAEAQVTGTEMANAVGGAALGERLKVTCTLPEMLARREARLATLLLLCCQSVMPRGGQIDLHAGPDGWRIEARAERLQTDKPAFAALASGSAMPPLIPAEVQFALAPDALAETGRRLHVQAGDGQLTLSF